MATIIICAIISPTFLSVNNPMNVIRQNVTIGIIACGAQIVILSGEIDLSAGSITAFAGCFATMVHVATGNLVLGLLTGLLIGAAVGLINGVILTVCNIPSFIVTLATQQGRKGRDPGNYKGKADYQAG